MKKGFLQRILALAIAFNMLLPVGVFADTKKDETTTITISAAGDCTLGVDSRYNNNFNNKYNQKGSKYFLKNVKSVFSADDITIVNLEGTLTTSTNRASKTFTFKGPQKYVNILTEGSVEVVNLANNHTMDFGQKGFDDTKKILKKKKIKYSYGTTIAYKTVKNVKVAFLGFNALSGAGKPQIKKAIADAKKHKAKIIVTSFHWGIERNYYPETSQKSLAHYAIDQGASLVIGHHPHVLQGLEEYKGRYILYSLGNFCFGGNSNPSDKDTMIYQQTFYVKNGKLTKKKDAKVIPCSLSGVSYSNDFQPKILKGNEKTRIIGKLNKMSKNMKVKIGKNGAINP